VARASFSLGFNLLLIASCVGLALAYLLAARWFLGRAQRFIADRERTRHWGETPVYRRPRRPLPRKEPAWEE
jgi:hypothetical protein